MAIDDGRVVSNFIVQALRGEPLTVYGDGNQTRSFCYVSDLVDGLVRLMENSSDIGPVNLGNPTEFTIRELAELVTRLVGSRESVAALPLPADDPKQRRPDISRAQQALGFRYTVPLAVGVERTIASIQAQLGKR
jgi:UDP-glucuronate decarboxylase